MSKLIDLTNQKFGRLTVIEQAGSQHGNAYWKCKCSCGAEVIVRGYLLTRQIVVSCGCYRKEHKLKHGLAHTPIYNLWAGIKNRCTNPNVHNYHRYGGRGVTMFEDWINNFQAFYDYVSKLPHYGEDGYSLDRINNDGNYEPDNIRWATRKEQARNKRSNHILEYQGVKMTLAEAAEKSGLSRYVLQNRLKHGDRGERLFRPVRK